MRQANVNIKMLGPENYIVIEHVLQVEQYQKWRILKSKQSNLRKFLLQKYYQIQHLYEIIVP